MTRSKNVLDNKPHPGYAFANLPQEERLKRLERIRILHPSFNRSLELIHECRERSKITAEPICGFITGDAGVGKSEVFKQYKNQNAASNGGVAGQSVVAIELTYRVPTPLALVEMLLQGMGAPNPTYGRNLGVKFNRLVNLIKATGVEIVLLDEFQNFVDQNSGKGKLLYDVSDCLKSLINATHVPFVLFGLHDTLCILRVNSQLNGRFQRRETLPVFPFKTESDRSDFRKLLTMIDQQLPFLQMSKMSDDHLSQKIYEATGGLMRFIKFLIRDAAMLAILKNHSAIEIEDWAESFDRNTCMSDTVKGNPFD
ncbi:MAG: TniB family NTP-binding protein [Alicyclobacillaceae bacterium]|nr:TniB family NTP-binding protein [Alicyclobacillaceae bacterium]